MFVKSLKEFLKGLSLEMDLAFDDIYYSGRTLRRYISAAAIKPSNFAVIDKFW
jgi:hypothetical protein